MDSSQLSKPAPTGSVVSPNEFFESIGKKADDVAPAATAEDGEDGEDGRKVVEEIESLCMNCHENFRSQTQGTTRLLLTEIPYFREIILSSFSCPHCSFKNSEVSPAGSIQPLGCRYELRLTTPADFQRQVIKSDTANINFIELDVEIPAGRGQLTNVEGLLRGVLEDLEVGQPARKTLQPKVHSKIEEVLEKGGKMLKGEGFPFRVVVDDVAGNSWISPDMRDGVGKWEKREYPRTPEQNESLGLAPTDANSTTTVQPSLAEAATASLPATASQVGRGNSLGGEDIVPNEVYSFPASCPGCSHSCVTHMKMVEIPHFKQVVLMSTVCDACGYRSNDIKTGGEIPDKGKRTYLRAEGARDLRRDILKSESCHLKCPELQLEVNPGTLGGRFTTVEGLLTQVRNDLHGQIFETGQGGDGMVPEEKQRWDGFFDTLDIAIAGEMAFDIILEDPLAGSYVQKLGEDGVTDRQVTEEEYERTEEEEEELGLRDMKVQGYEEGAEGKRDDGEAKETAS
ncbi:putative zinc finger protein zpr1 protein [Zalerion maritima]|uniref:Zinc finger protein zpr1 protein n=1 Tax=Zalerion maritima TaxID=339359 RepID=A0AAD5RS91_9PEZI|nr:putative zinc finger protein zpr1 protein [Zalerion maritima]